MLHDRSKRKEKKGQWLIIVLVVVMSDFITFIIKSTICKGKLAEADKLLSERYAESQDGHVNSVIEDNFDRDYENVEFVFFG